ncbi:lactose-binding lectin l-2-like [Melanotaenia boesemani]|uniref:lactose-binding lectin l-2-like n=1 Tax=Melanotaenia boesemani TaxID=1250792 RepID=UPI001C05DCDA|nr:lactose-binding lectin l-2-like [Melanotaenia boesemani]
MLLFFFLFGLALGIESPPDELEVKLQRGGCPMFWYSFNSRCYKYFASRMTWADAEIHCMSQGANLVSIHSMDEYHFVQSLIKNFDHAQGHTWIGLSDTHKEGTWMWSDGTKVDFTIWSERQPDNFKGREHCVHTNFFGPRWNDIRCSYTYTSVCATRIPCP